MGRILVILTLLLLTGVQPAASYILDYRYQKAFRVQSLSLEQGLSQSVVLDILQDQDGYMWIATEDGLNRFDGYEFKIFEHNHKDPQSLHDNYVHAIAEDPGYGMWIGTLNGLSNYDPKTETFTNYQSLNPDLKTSIVDIMPMGEDEVYLASENGLYVYRKSTNQIELFQSQHLDTIETEVTTLTANEDLLWVATEGCIYSLDSIAHQLYEWCVGDLGKWLESKVTYSIKVKDGSLWIATDNGVARYHLESHQLETFNAEGDPRYSIASNWAQDLAFDENGNLWIATADGLSLYRYADSSFEHFKHKAHDSDGLTSNDIFRVYVDKTGLIWIGTYATGVNILDPSQSGFKHILTKSDLADYDASNTIHGISKDNNENLWMASFGGGVIRLNLMTGEISRPFYAPMMQLNSNHRYAFSLRIDYDNRLWVGTADGLFIYDLEQQRILDTRFKINGKEQKFSALTTYIYEDHAGDIWLATNQGLFQVQDVTTQESIASVSLIDKRAEIPASYLDRAVRVSAIVETQDGNFWIGGPSGLLFHDREKQEWQHFEYHFENSQSLSNDDVQVLYEDSRGTLWVGTANGLNKVYRRTNEEIYFERITKEQGLPNNSIYGILEDNYKQLWLSTNLGLVRYSGVAEGVQSYRRTDGISSDEFNTGAYYIDTSGNLYFGSINGVTVVDSRATHDASPERKLIFSELLIGDREIDLYQLNRNPQPQVTISQEEKAIKVTVADLYYQKLRTQSYRYRLLGLDDDWIYLNKDRTFILAGLLEGRYLLDIQSKVGNEPWSKHMLRLELNVEHDFIHSRYAAYVIGFSGLILFFGVIYLIRRFYQNKLAKVENLVKIEEIRLKDSRKKNDELKRDIDEKSNQISRLSDELTESSRKLDSYNFRDKVSGLYRFENLARLLSDNLLEDPHQSQHFNLFAIFELIELNQVEKEYGKIATSEIIQTTAAVLKKYCPAGVQICDLRPGCFIVLGEESQDKQFVEVLQEVCHQLASRKFEVNNGQTISTALSLAYIKLEEQSVNDLNLVFNLANLLLTVQANLASRIKDKTIRLDLNMPLENINQKYTIAEIKRMFKKNKIAILEE